MDAQFNRALQMLKGRKEIKAKYLRLAREIDGAADVAEMPRPTPL